ncbi:MAG TPA: SCO family protein [Jatrophihabitans sp.]|nr:SCO family protein [Jatrophihabitans sp.]
MSARSLVAVLAAAVLVAGCTSGNGATPSSGGSSPSELNDHTDSSYAGLGLDPAQPRPQFTLTDTAGKPYRFGSVTAGKPTLLYFGYTHCPDVCPTTLADITQALQRVPAAIRSATQVVFVTTDVKRDTPAVLSSYLSKFDPGLPNRFVGLTGSQSAIDAAQVAAHVTLATDDGQTHAAEVLLYGSDDYARVAFLQSDNEVDQIAHDLSLVAGTK